MKPEQRMWAKAKVVFDTYALCQRHEDRYSPSIPDVSFVRRSDGRSGWIELKTIEKWGDKLTRIPHLDPGQVNWLSQRSKLGASCWMLLWVRLSDEWLWIPGHQVTHHMTGPGLPAEEYRALDLGNPLYL